VKGRKLFEVGFATAIRKLIWVWLLFER
jgi:hypothetical protein